MNIEQLAIQAGFTYRSNNDLYIAESKSISKALQTFADLVIKNYHDENYQVRTDNTQLIANMEAKIAELELHKCNKCNISVGGNNVPISVLDTELTAENDRLRQRVAELEARINDISTDWLVNQEKLRVAIEALENCLGGDDYYNRPLITEALNKIRS
jgi:hypothetical protein